MGPQRARGGLTEEDMSSRWDMDNSVGQRKHNTSPQCNFVFWRTVVTVKDRGVCLQHSLSSVHHLGARRAQRNPSSWGYLAPPHLYIVRWQMCSCLVEILFPHINCVFWKTCHFNLTCFIASPGTWWRLNIACCHFQHFTEFGSCQLITGFTKECKH